MKKIFSISLFASFVFMISTVDSFSQNYWTKLISPVTKNLTNCSFINSNTGWISGDSGIVIHTSNGGSNWTIQNTGIYNNIEDIYFYNQRNGWALAYVVSPDSGQFLGTLILNTKDGGNTWNNSMFPDTNMYMKTVFFIDSLRGFIGGVASSIVLTTDGGTSWTYTDTDSSLFFRLPVFKIKFYNYNLGYACGGFRDIAGITWVTTNAGLNWKGAVLAPEPFFDLTILNSQKTICSGGDLEYGSSIAITTDQGQNWYYDTLGVFGLASGIDNRTQSEIWMASNFGAKFIFSSDTGNTWISVETPENTSIFDVDFTDTSRGYACGLNGVILKYDNTVSNIVNHEFQIQENNYMLYQNYPNPFNPKTVISYYLPENSLQTGSLSFVSLKVFDILGKEAATLVNQYSKPGNYSSEFDGNEFHSGIYFYRLSIKNPDGSEFIHTKRMLLLK